MRIQIRLKLSTGWNNDLDKESRNILNQILIRLIRKEFLEFL